MGRGLRRGDRIRVRRAERADKHSPGDKGTVLSGPYVPAQEMPPVVCSDLKKGDRVRVTARNRMYGYQPGDKGTVLRDVVTGPSGSLQLN